MSMGWLLRAVVEYQTCAFGAAAMAVVLMLSVGGMAYTFDPSHVLMMASSGVPLFFIATTHKREAMPLLVPIACPLGTVTLMDEPRVAVVPSGELQNVPLASVAVSALPATLAVKPFHAVRAARVPLDNETPPTVNSSAPPTPAVERPKRRAVFMAVARGAMDCPVADSGP